MPHRAHSANSTQQTTEMNTKEANLKLSSIRSTLRGVAIALGILVGAAITIFFGLTPFVAAFVLQLCVRRPLSDAILLLLGATTALVLWYLLDWLPLVVGQPPPLWPSVFLSTFFSAGFSVSGAFICRKVFARRFTSTLNDHNA